MLTFACSTILLSWVIAWKRHLKNFVQKRHDPQVLKCKAQKYIMYWRNKYWCTDGTSTDVLTQQVLMYWRNKYSCTDGTSTDVLTEQVLMYWRNKYSCSDGTSTHVLTEQVHWSERLKIFFQSFGHFIYTRSKSNYSK